MARESVVLLKNDGLLPLDRAKIRKIAVIGINATLHQHAAGQLRRRCRRIR